MARIEIRDKTMDVVPTKGRVLVRHYTVSAVSKGGIVIPATARQTEKLSGTSRANGLLPLAEILDVGPDVRSVKAGDVVLVEEGGQGIGLGETYVLYEMDRILGVVSDIDDEAGIEVGR